MKRRVLALGLALSMVAPALIPAAGADFVDVPTTHWAYPYIQRAVNEGTLNGTGNNCYEPGRTVTLAEFLVLVCRGYYAEELAYHQAVLEGRGARPQWYTAACVLALEKGLTTGADCDTTLTQTVKGIMSGGEDQTLATTSVLSRQDMGVILYWTLRGRGVPAPRLEELAAVWEKSPNLQTETGEKAEKIAFCYHYGILKGVDSQGTFKGEDPTDRASMAVVCTSLRDTVTNFGGLAEVVTPKTEQTPPEAP